jgi:hypothetical protein
MKNVLINTLSVNAAAREEMMELIGSINQDRKDAINSGSAFVSDRILQVVKNVAAKNSIKMFLDSDVKVTGLCDINGGKLEKGEIFCVSSIILLSAVGAANTLADAASLEFGQIAKELRNANFEFKVNSKTIVPMSSTEAFVNYRDTASGVATTAPTGAGFVGHYKLATPQLIETQAPIEFNIECAAANANFTFIKVILVGAAVVNK